MANYERFTPQEIPYEILERFGLTREMIDDLPQNVMQRLLSARTTPVLPIITENVEGLKIRSFARFYLVRLDDGTVDVCFVPQWVDEDLEAFSIDQQEKLKRGEVTIADMKGQGRCFVQFDETIKQVMAVPVSIICQNISILTRSFNLSTAEKELLEDGGIVEMEINHQIASAGIDLNEMTGIRIAEGDTLAWKQDAKADSLPKYNFGLFGCWVADDDNVLTYVAEDDYSPELVEEQKRTQTMHAAEAQLKQLKL